MIDDFRHLVAGKLYVDINPQPDFIGQIPAGMVLILIDGNFVRIPFPVVAIGNLARSYRPGPSIKPNFRGPPPANCQVCSGPKPPVN